MRLNVRTLFLVLFILVIVSTLLFWYKCSDRTFDTLPKIDNPNHEVSIEFYNHNIGMFNRRGFGFFSGG